MKDYEALFIFKADLVDDKLEKEIKSIERSIKTRGKGEVKYDVLGKKALNYPIKKLTEGVYVNFQFTAQPSAIAKIKDAIKHKENILRSMFLTRDK